MKFKNGNISDFDGNQEDVIVDSKNAPIGIGNLAVGIGLIAAGVIHLMWKSFASGAIAEEIGEYDALDKLHLLGESKECVTRTAERPV